MNKTEAERIAAAVNIAKPDWSTPLLMKVLGDERMIRRPYADAMLALMACALDPTTTRPGRVHEKGPWWSAIPGAGKQAGPAYKQLGPDDCDICSQPESMHPLSLADDHEFEPMNTRGKGATPTPDQRAAIDEANKAAQVEVTKAKEADEGKQVRDMDAVLESHRSEGNDERKTA